jgi:glycyl-tRNA synthetase beta chain
MTDFLLELRCEEIPARMQAGARADLEKLFRQQLGEAGVAVGEVTVWSTPRRLALIGRELPEATEAVREETKGPRTSAPPQALEGFLRKTGLTQDRLEDRDGVWFAVVEKPGRAVRDVLAEAIPAIVRAFPWPKSMRWGAASLSTGSLRWVRPLSGIVAIFGEELVEFEIDGVASGYTTLGHRFHCPGAITIGSAADYREKLRACHVIVDHEERQDLIREGARKAAAEAGLALVEDEGLVIENAGLTEWPVPLLGRFDEAFLEVPPEVIQLTARVNQKYFVCTPLPLGGGPVDGNPSLADTPTPGPSRKREGNLANAFVCTANIEATDGGAAIVDGNRKVLAARLSDARFFWDQDRKTKLEDHAKKLERITFHEKLGTVADKVERVAKLARWLVEEGIVGGADASPNATVSLPGGEGPGEGPAPSQATPNTLTQPSPSRGRAELADLAERAARLCKADLVTEMVGEFPELQGLMGGYYARAEGLPAEVADAIRDHYKPVGQGDIVPTAPVTVAVSLADKLDTLVAFFLVQERPTGSKDPFALRRAGIALAALILTNGLRVPLAPTVMQAMFGVLGPMYRGEVFSTVAEITPTLQRIDDPALAAAVFDKILPKRSLPDDPNAPVPVIQRDRENAATLVEIIGFVLDRLKVQQREAGVRHDLIDAVFALGGEDDLVRLLARVRALQAFIGTEDGANLHAGYKRAANILKKEEWKGVEGEIARTGEEDPLAVVDDPDLAPVIAAKMELKHRKELSYTPEPAESALIAALDSAEPEAAAAIEAEDFERAMRALASLRAPIDRFFDEVTVNDEDPNKRAARLDLLARFRDAVRAVADFSRIEG